MAAVNRERTFREGCVSSVVNQNYKTLVIISNTLPLLPPILLPQPQNRSKSMLPFLYLSLKRGATFKRSSLTTNRMPLECNTVIKLDHAAVWEIRCSWKNIETPVTPPKSCSNLCLSHSISVYPPPVCLSAYFPLFCVLIICFPYCILNRGNELLLKHSIDRNSG